MSCTVQVANHRKATGLVYAGVRTAANAGVPEPEPSRYAPPTPAANPPPHQNPNKTWNPPTTPHNTTQRNRRVCGADGRPNSAARSHRYEKLAVRYQATLTIAAIGGWL